MNKTLRMTKESLLAAQPCYNENQLNELPIPPDGATPQQIASYNEIPVKDRIWALCYALNVGEAQRAQFDKILLTFACDVAEDAFQRAKTAPVEIKQLIDITRKFVNGEASKDELDSAIRNADTAFNAYNTADDAAYRLACNAYDTANDAAYNVARDTAYRLAYNVAIGAVYRLTYNVYRGAAYNATNNDQELLQKYLDMLAERLS